MSHNVVNFVKSQLALFTGLGPSELKSYLERKKYPNFKDEWKFWKPDTDANINWFYMTNRGYLFANAIHILPKEVYDDIGSDSKVLDFGGGAGNFSFSLAKKGCSVEYFDVNVVQKEFVKFVANNESLDIKVLDYGRDFLPDTSDLDSIIALDVLEHIPDYRKYVQRFAKILKDKGLLYVFAPFGESPSDPTHLNDKFGFDQVMKDSGFNLNKKIMTSNGISVLVFQKGE